MTGNGRSRAKREDTPRETYEPISLKHFKKHTPLEDEMVNQLWYGLYRDATQKISRDSVHGARRTQINILSTIKKLNVNEIGVYLATLNKKGMNPGTMETLSENYLSIKKLPTKASDYFINDLFLDGSNELLQTILKESQTGELQYAHPDTVALISDIFNSLKRQQYFSQGRQNLRTYGTLAESALQLAEKGEKEKTIQAYIVKSCAETDSWSSAVAMLNFSHPDSQIVLNKARSGIDMELLTKELSFFAGALSGLPLKVVVAKNEQDAYFDGKNVRLPTDTTIDDKINGRHFYRAATAHQAGQIEFGTFDIEIKDLEDIKEQLEQTYGREQS